MIFEILVAILCTLLLALYLHFKRSYRFWRERNVPFLEPTFPSGNMIEAVKTKKHFAYIMDDIYRHMQTRPDVTDYCGIFFFHKPALCVMTPEFAKTVLVRDFGAFADRGVYSNEKLDPIGGNLFFLEGHRWRFLRQKISPVFTSGKLRAMFGTVAEVGERFVAHLRPHAESCADVDVYDLLARFLTEVISSCAFGFESNSLDEPDNQFRVMGGKALNPTKFRSLVMFVAMTFREKARKLGIVFNTAEMNSFFMSLVSDTIEHRKSSGARRNDFMQLMMELMERDDENGERLSFNEVAAQAFIFYVAGFETSSTVLAFALYSLALDRNIQAKARNHVRAVLEKFDGKWSYEAVMEMTYVEQIIEETLRLYPPVATLHRMTTREYTLPNGSKIPKETGVIIPILAIQRDPQHFPDPLKFDPDRFSAENKTKRHPFASIPFGEGPRYCIGMRFGQLQSRLSLAMLLKNFEFEPCDKTEYPIKIDTIKLTHCPKGEVRLRIRKA